MAVWGIPLYFGWAYLKTEGFLVSKESDIYIKATDIEKRHTDHVSLEGGTIYKLCNMKKICH